MNKQDLEKFYEIYRLDEVGHNTMTLGEFEKKMETDAEFKRRFVKDMTPKKIYLLGSDLEFIANNKNLLYLVDASKVDILGNQHPYILESEHQRIVDQLKNRIRVLENLIPQTNEIKNHDGDF
jgi:hypothetical protein